MFDLGFINAELDRLGKPEIAVERIVDTLALARRKHPMGPNSLDALCKRYGIDNSHRTLHGALLDSEILAEVYIELIGGKQTALGLSSSGRSGNDDRSGNGGNIVLRQRPAPLAPRISDKERAAHDALVAKMGDKAIWKKYVS
jgi:DNA polymerase-3 subunit epsilon